MSLNLMLICVARLFSRPLSEGLKESPTAWTPAVLNLISQVQCEIDKHQRVQIRQIFWKIDFQSNCQKWTALPDTKSPPKYFILEKFRKSMTRAKGHVSVITKIVSARELRYERGRSWIEHSRLPDQRSAFTNHDMIFIKITCSCFSLLG